MVHCAWCKRSIGDHERYEDIQEGCRICPECCDRVAPVIRAKEVGDLRERVRELEKLAFLGEHHFPDLTWKARCEELISDMRRLEGEVSLWKERAERARFALTSSCRYPECRAGGCQMLVRYGGCPTLIAIADERPADQGAVKDDS